MHEVWRMLAARGLKGVAPAVWLTVWLAANAFTGAVAQTPADDPGAGDPPAGEAGEEQEDVLAGHSYHGEAFNEGPRQRAYLIEGMSRVRFPVTTSSEEAQAFVEQGVAQLHGFWYFEAERSFRQAAALDPDCAMAYWGMAMANHNNAERARGFLEEAQAHKDTATDRERRYIDALTEFRREDEREKKARAQAYIKALEGIIYEYPEDIEARAFLVVHLWNARGQGIPIASHVAVDALLGEIFAVEPMHAAHHYRIHLWDYERPERALESAGLCGPSSPGIAHMWHMPGHIYWKLKRYSDSAWQQEASARVDHAHMMRDRVMPDQISNFAHNNEWLVRSLMHVGRVEDALDLAKNMIELPRHPRYNSRSKRGSFRYGRMRLVEVLTRYELWEETLALAETPYLSYSEDRRGEQIEWMRLVGIAAFHAGQRERGQETLDAMRELRVRWEEQRDQAVSEAVESARAETREGESDEARETRLRELATKTEEPFDRDIEKLDKSIARVEGHRLALEEQFAEALEKLNEGGDEDPMWLAWVRLQAGEVDAAINAARQHVNRRPNETVPQARLVHLLWEAGRTDEARDAFEALRRISGDIDMQSPVFQRLTPIAAALDLPQDWRVVPPLPDDLGPRPLLDSLGPFRWSPSPAPDWTLPDADARPVSLKEYRGRPVIVIFYLGYGCLHCAEQLQAFAPKTEEFEEAGIAVVAISSDDQAGLQRSIEDYSGEAFPFPLVSDEKLETFRNYRAYDDFEEQPLHGTFVIDAEGRVRWQDISYEPFMDPDFVLEEAQRLLQFEVE